MNKALLRETQLSNGFDYALAFDGEKWWATPIDGDKYARPRLTIEEPGLPADPAARAEALQQLQLELAVATLAVRL